MTTDQTDANDENPPFYFTNPKGYSPKSQILLHATPKTSTHALTDKFNPAV